MNGYRLVLSLKYGKTVLVHKRHFASESDARAFASNLPHGFVPVPDSTINPDTAIFVPLKEPKARINKKF